MSLNFKGLGFITTKCPLKGPHSILHLYHRLCIVNAKWFEALSDSQLYTHLDTALCFNHAIYWNLFLTGTVSKRPQTAACLESFRPSPLQFQSFANKQQQDGPFKFGSPEFSISRGRVTPNNLIPSWDEENQMTDRSEPRGCSPYKGRMRSLDLQVSTQYCIVSNRCHQELLFLNLMIDYPIYSVGAFKPRCKM